MTSAYPIEDVFEKLAESNFIGLLKAQYTRNDEFLKNFPLRWIIDTVGVTGNGIVYTNVTWTDMKTKFGWGFSKGKVISPLIDWIFIRPDVATAIRKNKITINSLLSNGILNFHFFIVKTKAVKYFLSACTEVIEKVEESSSSNDEDEIDEYPDVPKGIDYQAIVQSARNVKHHR